MFIKKGRKRRKKKRRQKKEKKKWPKKKNITEAVKILIWIEICIDGNLLQNFSFVDMNVFW